MVRSMGTTFHFLLILLHVFHRSNTETKVELEVQCCNIVTQFKLETFDYVRRKIFEV